MTITALGARGSIPDTGAMMAGIAESERRRSVIIQLFRADRIFGADHLLSAAEKAVRAFDDGTNMARALGMEMLLFAAAERQTSVALEKLGISDGITSVAVVIIGDADPNEVLNDLGLERDDSVLDPAGKDPAVFGIRDAELAVIDGERVCELVLERVAMSGALR